MAKGDGSIISIGRNKWEVQLSFGYIEDEDGNIKRDRVSRTVYGLKADARRVRDEVRQEHEQKAQERKLSTDIESRTFAEHAEKWKRIQEDTGGLSSSTLDENDRIIRYLSEHIGDMKLKDITADVVESLYTTVKEQHHYGGTSMHKIHVKLKQILKHAVNHDLIPYNPCDRVQAPKIDNIERRSLTREEALRLLQCVDAAEAAEYEALKDREAREGHWCTDGISHHTGRPRTAIRGIHDLSNIMAVRIGLATGMRLGEVLALVWDDIDLTKGKIHVRHSLTKYGEVKSPKSKAGVRTISLDGITRLHLITWKAEQARNLKKLGVIQTMQTPVCCSDTGSICILSHFERWWGIWRKDHGFEGLKYHQLRHTQATQLLANGVDVKTVQTRLGHSDASLTLNVYGHAIPENDESAAELIGNLFTENGEARIIEVKTA